MKTIPLVIHIVYNPEIENISDDQIASQIVSLNQDFSRTNPDKSQTPSAFTPVAADTGIRFCHVKTIRKKTMHTQFSDNDDVKAAISGGSDPLDTSKYMNVWVCNLGNRLLGYAEAPNTQKSNTYGVVINYGAFGNTGTARSPYNKGRTLTHEISHCLGVLHTFSESQNTSSCVKTDHCADIPAQSTPSHGCPNFPRLDNCSITTPGVMFMNYMDYSDDSCMNMFSLDQAKRMNAVLNISPYNTLAITGCDKVPDGPIKTIIKSKIMTIRNKLIILIIISILIIIAIWTQKASSPTSKIIYTLIYLVIGAFIYKKWLSPNNINRLAY